MDNGNVYFAFLFTLTAHVMSNRFSTSGLIMLQINSTDPVELMEDDGVMDALVDAGITSRITASNKVAITDALALHGCRISRCKWMWDAVWDGAETLGLRTLLRAQPGK